MSQRRRSHTWDISSSTRERRQEHYDLDDLHTIPEQSGSTTMHGSVESRGGSDVEGEERVAPEHISKGDEVVRAIESPVQQNERLENAESLFSISQAPDEARLEEGVSRARRSDNGSDASRKKRVSRPRLLSTSSHISEAIESPVQEYAHREDAESLFSIDQPPEEAEVEEGASPAPELEPYDKQATKVYPPMQLAVISSLIPGSIFGVLVRLGLLALANYDQHATFPLAWVQGAGCLVMGFALGLRDQIGAYYGPLYTAIATGFCGSVTTFSSWQLDVFISWANTEHAHRDWFRDVIDGLDKTFFTLAISLSSVTLGLHLSRPVSRRLHNIKRASVRTRYIFRAVSVLLYVATIPVYFKTSPTFRHQATAALLFSFPGTLVRYILSTKLTPLFHLFPLGTFVANTVGTALLGIFHVLQRTPQLPSPNGCAILQGLMDGFCGCLTTVSTFAVEVQALKTRRAWLYVTLSWGVGQLLLVVILGTAWWGANIDDNRVCSFQ